MSKPLIHTKAFPVSTASIIKDNTAFQGLRAIGDGKIAMPLRIDSNDVVILDFGNHFVGYLNFSLNHYEEHITDSPIILRFTFAEKPLELLTSSEKYIGIAAYSWIQEETKIIPFIGIYVYTLKQLLWLAEYLSEPTDEIKEEITVGSEFLLSYYCPEKNLFISGSGQISWQSQIFAILAEVLSAEENIKVLNAIEQSDTSFNIRSPYMMHYYIDALWSVGQKEKAVQKIKEYWSVFVNYGFDCCPELYSADDHFLSPFFKAPEVDSMCHAWSCTPVYWLHRYADEEQHHFVSG